MWTTEQVRAGLRELYPIEAYALFFEVRNRTGYSGGGRERYADAVVMGLWPSRGIEVIGIEIKVSRSDWVRERADPAKADAIQRYCDRWYLAVGDRSIVEPGELPSNWGLIAPGEKRGKGKLKALVQAPKCEADSLDKAFIASLARAAQGARDAGEGALVRAKAEELAQSLTADARARAARDKERLLELEQAIAAFERESGISIRHSGQSLQQVGRLINILGSGDLRRFRGTVGNLRKLIASLESPLSVALDLCAELEKIGDDSDAR